MKNAIVMPLVLIVTVLISILIATYITMSSTHISKEYYRDLAEVRGYWGAYGAKELNNSMNYHYANYDINVTKNVNNYKWSLSPISSGITNDDLYNRVITVKNAEKNDTNITKYKL